MKPLNRTDHTLSPSARLALVAIIVLAWAVVASGIDWGLPSMARKDAIFGQHSQWTGEQIKAYDTDATAVAADVDASPRPADTLPAWLTDSNADRAQIVRRYLLFSNQPDEMITFMALRQMKPARSEFDPRLYQYGGLWIYPVGALLRIGAAAGVLELKPDVAYYYDHPGEFGKFYVVARAYSAFWLAVLIAGVAMAVRRISGSDVAAICAGGLAALMPAAFAMAHEAKPHLPGAALMLLACLAANRWSRRGRLGDALLAGALCGLAAGMVLTAAVIGIVLPMMIFAGRGPVGRRFAHAAIAIAVAAGVYATTNPYVVINLLDDPQVLRANLANTRAMYQPSLSLESLHDAAGHGLAALSIPLAIATAVAVVMWLARPRRLPAMAIVLIAPAMVVCIQFVLFAAGKPGEYGRFAIFPAAVAIIHIGWAIARLPTVGVRVGAAAVIAVATAVISTRPYLTAFANDATGNDTRTAVSRWLLNEPPMSVEVLEIHAEPAPYAVPPLDLWRWRLLLTHASDAPRGDVCIRAIDAPPIAPPPSGYKRIIFDGGHLPRTNRLGG